MAESNRCPRCKAEIPAEAPEGLCPHCVFRAGFPLESGSPATADSACAGSSELQFEPPAPIELASRFPELEILELIGRGGMGVVYKARQIKLDRLVALKILLPQIAQDRDFAQRFAREARAMALLNHPHIVTVYDFGQTAASLAAAGPGTASDTRGEEPLFYFVMEFVDGLTLRQLLAADTLAPQEALAIVPQICEALQYAHDKGVVHRDIKPENILLDRSGQVKIADFGLAKLVGRPAQGLDFTLTGTGQVMGTPHYMAPEQLEHPQSVDHRADIYSLGVVFYQMLTGELPLGRFAPPSRKVQVDVRLDEVVLRALEKDPEQRYQQASEVKTEVDAIRQTPPAGYQAGTAGARPALVAGDDALEQARLRVLGPAIGLLITGILNLLIPLVVLTYLGPGSSLPHLVVVPMIVVLLASLCCSSLVISGALKMMRLEAYGLANTASILAILVSPTNLIGLGIGIWALVMLSRAEVRTAFDRRERSRPRSTPATPRQRKLGMAALGLCLASLPISLLTARIVSQPGVAQSSMTWVAVLMLFLLIELIALICGIAGRRSFAGKVAAILSAIFLALGMLLFFHGLQRQAERDFGGWPSVQRVEPSGPNMQPPIWEIGPDGHILTNEFARQKLELTPEQTHAVNGVLQAAFREGFALETQHTKQETRPNGHLVSRVDAFPAEWQKIEDRLWTQLDQILVTTQQQQCARASLTSRSTGTHITTPGPINWTGSGSSVIEIWRMGTWYHWKFNDVGGESSSPALPEDLRRFWKEPASDAEDGAAKVGEAG
ncbi:MAG: serine/threonine-protein kinase [Pirellulaceae bacterium]